jgi:hypothetical protein
MTGKSGFANMISNIPTLAASQLNNHVQLGSQHYYGFAAKRLERTNLGDMHKTEEMDLNTEKFIQEETGRSLMLWLS